MQSRQPLLDTVEVTEITLASYEAHWLRHQQYWQDAGPFVTPAWLNAWWLCFGEKKELLLLRVSRDGDIFGLAPLMVDGQTAWLIGSDDLCDYLDFLVLPDHGKIFFNALLNCLESKGITRLILEPVRAVSSVMEELVPLVRSKGYKVEINPKNTSVKMVLPASWDEYLTMLGGKQRHEVRRKLRRFYEAGSITTRNIREPAEVAEAMARFFQMFRQSRKDKDRFLTPTRKKFFQELASGLACSRMLDILEVDINGSGAAMVFCVNLGSTTYLYNNGFNPDYRALSVGVVSKLLTIRRSIENGMQFYDFLGGDEQYKSRLGGTDETLFSCCISMES